MKQLAIAVWLMVLGVGCARFSTTQTDMSYDDEGFPLRTITTRVKVATFFDGKSALASSRTTNTDKTQSTSLGGLNQETSGSNTVQIVRIIVEGARPTP